MKTGQFFQVTSAFKLDYATSTASFNTSLSKITCPPVEMTSKELQTYFLILAFSSVTFGLSVIGNACVLMALWLRRSKLNRMHLFIVHLAIADLVVAFFQVLPEIIERLVCGFYATNAGCKFVKFMQILGMYGSTYVLICTAFDRFVAVCYPMKSLGVSRGFVHCAVAVTWFVSSILSIPQVFLFSQEENSPNCLMSNDITLNRAYTTWFFFMILVFPTFLLSFFYGMITCTIVRNARHKKRNKKRTETANRSTFQMLTRSFNGGIQQNNFTPRASGVGVITKAKLKTVKMTFVIVITFIICWSPFYSAQMIRAWNLNDEDVAIAVLHVFGNLNSCTNPWIYLCFSGSLMKELQKKYNCLQLTRKKNKEKENCYNPQKDGMIQICTTDSVKLESVHSERT